MWVATTVDQVHVVVATAEPRGAYHLTPLGAALDEADSEFTHLVPYPEPVQGDAAMQVAHDASLIEACDRVVVTGGTFSAWTELVARRAASLGKPVIFTELACVGNSDPIAPHVEVARATAMSPDGADALGRYLGLDTIVVTGTPALDDLPAWRPVPRRTVLLSTSDMAQRDPDFSLVAVGATLRADGWDVRVRLHPREDPGPWDGFSLVTGETQAESAASAQVVIGYPGSAHVLAAAVGVPVIALAPTEALRAVFTPAQHAAMSAHTTGVPDTLDWVGRVAVAGRETVAAVVGPVGGAAERIVVSWTDPLL